MHVQCLGESRGRTPSNELCCNRFPHPWHQRQSFQIGLPVIVANLDQRGRTRIHPSSQSANRFITSAGLCEFPWSSITWLFSINLQSAPHLESRSS
jgi:hypothetical protein